MSKNPIPIAPPDPKAEEIDIYKGWYGFDTENNDKGHVTLTCLIHESGERWIWKKRGMLKKFIDDRAARHEKGTIVIICHNVEYDLVNEFGDEYPYLALNYLKGRLISARYKCAKFIDSFNHFRMGLAQIGQSIGIQKKDMDIYSEEYVATDAWICLRVMTQARDYIASLGGQIGATSGSSSISVWRHMTQDEYVYGTVDNEWLREGYYGGRTEIFQRHVYGTPMSIRPKGENLKKSDYCNSDIRGYDINSMYPFCMMADYPEYLMEDKRFEKAKGMAEVTISIPHDLFVAPLPHRHNESLCYPVGVVRGVWTYDEIRFAESLGSKVLEVHKAYGCNSLVRPFDEFILTLYEKRKASTSESEKLFLKVVMNSLYGKIASKSCITRTVSRHSLLQNGSKRLEEVKWIDHQRGLLDFYGKPPPYVNVCWGSMITANSRILLAKYMLKVPKEKLIYCDTDSVYCVDHTLPESKELGGMKLEHSAREMLVVQPKSYMIDQENKKTKGEFEAFYKAKGVPKAKKDDDGRIIIDFARQYIEEGFTQFQQPIRFRQSINSKRGVVNQWVTNSKRRRSEYTSKAFSNGFYHPRVIGKQMELFPSKQIAGKKQPKK